jgi:hypothetical protein
MVSTSRRNPFEELHHSSFLTFDEKRHHVIVFFFHGSFFGICKKRSYIVQSQLHVLGELFALAANQSAPIFKSQESGPKAVFNASRF